MPLRPEGAEAEHLLKDVEFCNDAYEAADGADCIVLLTEWDQFRALELDRVQAVMRSPVVIDLRNIYTPSDMRELGFEYFSVGRS